MNGFLAAVGEYGSTRDGFAQLVKRSRDGPGGSRGFSPTEVSRGSKGSTTSSF
jgi:hypothetical protein